MIKPFYDTKNIPKHFSKTGTQFSVAPLSLMNERGLSDPFLESIIKYLPKGAYVSGSFVAHLLRPDLHFNDIDIFFTSSEAFKKTYLLFKDPPNKKEAWACQGYKTPMSMEDLEAKSSELKNVTLTHEKHPPIHLIKTFWYEDPEHIIDSFDLTLVQFAVDKTKFIYNPLSLLDLMKKQIVIHRVQFASNTLRRIIKYSHRGFFASSNTLSNLAQQLYAKVVELEEAPVKKTKTAKELFSSFIVDAAPIPSPISWTTITSTPVVTGVTSTQLPVQAEIPINQRTRELCRVSSCTICRPERAHSHTTEGSTNY